MSSVVLEIKPFSYYDHETNQTVYGTVREFSGSYTSAAEGSLIRFLRIEDKNGNDITPSSLQLQWKTLGASLFGETGDDYQFPFFGRGGQDISLSAGGYTSGKITIANTNNGNALPPTLSMVLGADDLANFSISYNKNTDPENFGGGGLSGLQTTQYRLLANGEQVKISSSGTISTQTSPFITTYTAEVDYMDAQGYVRTISSDDSITLGLISEAPRTQFASFNEVNIALINNSPWPGFSFISQDRDLTDGNTGISLYSGNEEIQILGNRYSLNPSGGTGAQYLFSDPSYLYQSIWIDLDGNVALSDPYGNPLTTGPGMQGNQLGDDLISGFDSVRYNGAFNTYSNYSSDYAIALLSDEQGQYVLVQDRNLTDGNDGTDTLRRVRNLNFDGTNILLSDLTEYDYFLSQPFLSSQNWIDLDGNVALSDGTLPEPGQQGNQEGDDLIIGFDNVVLAGNYADYSVTRHIDSQGIYYLARSNNIESGLDTLRRVRQITFDDAVVTIDPPPTDTDSKLRLQTSFRNSDLELLQAAVLGDSVDAQEKYTLEIRASATDTDTQLASADITITFDPVIFEDLQASDITFGGGFTIANAVEINNSSGTIRIAAAALNELSNSRVNFSDADLLASIKLDFDEAALTNLTKNHDGSLASNPLSFLIASNLDETVFSRTFNDGTTLENREILTLRDLGGSVSVDGNDVTLYEAQINLEQQHDGLIMGTQRVIGADAAFTNLIRSGDTITTSANWLNVGNIQANNLSVSALENSNASLVSSSLSSSSIQSGSFINGVFNPDGRESVTLTADIKITGNAGSIVDLADGILSIQAGGSDVFSNAGKGSSNLITFQGDLNYDGRVSMKDLAYLNAGAARQRIIDDQAPDHIDPASVARDVDADFNGVIDLADLAVLDADWGKSLHTGDEQFIGSADLSWEALDAQGAVTTWDNSSFKDQNAIESVPTYVGSLESPSAIGVIGADGNSTSNDGDIQSSYFQDPITA